MAKQAQRGERKGKKALAQRVTPEKLLDGVTGRELSQQLSPDAARTERIEMRVSRSEKELMQRLADSAGVTVTRLLVALVELAAKRLPPGGVG